MKVQNVNHLIAVLKEVRDAHGQETPVEFRVGLGSRPSDEISVKVVTVRKENCYYA
jgi:hypothetical protein